MSDDLIRSLKKKSKAKKSDVVESESKRVYPKFADCPDCHGTLYKDDGTPCICKTDFILSRSLCDVGVGENFIRVNLAYYQKNFSNVMIRVKKGLNGKYLKRHFGIDYLIDFVKLYARTFQNRLCDGQGFILAGDCGGGKSSAAIWIMKRLALANYRNQFSSKSKKVTMQFIEAQRILDKIKDTWDDNSPTKYKSKAVLESLESVDLLVIDDLGAEYSASFDWMLSIFLKYIKSRINSNKPTIITMNYTPEQMSERFSSSDFPRLASVLTEKFQVILIENPTDIRESIANGNDLFKTMSKEVKR